MQFERKRKKEADVKVINWLAYAMYIYLGEDRHLIIMTALNAMVTYIYNEH